MEQMNQQQGGTGAPEGMSRKASANLDFLHTVYKNAETGITSIDTILKHVTDEEMREVLLKQYDDYDKYCTKLAKHITAQGETPKKNNPFTKAQMWSSINFSALMDDSSSHIADMMIKGSNMGITALNKELNAHSGELDRDAEAMAKELLALEQNNIEQLKPYL